MNLAVGDSRVSTVDQAAEGVSLEAQSERIAAWCRAHGRELDGGRVHVDAGLSSKRSDNRPGLAAALESACRPGVVLVVYSLSRLARSTRDTIEIAERLHRAGADLVSLTESIDTTSASGKMLFRLLAVLAEFERDLVAERTRSALALKRSKGERIGQVPYGSDLAPDGRTLVPNPREAAAIEDARRLRSGGWSLGRIAAEFDRRGLATKNGGAKWSHRSVSNILKRGVRDDTRSWGDGAPGSVWPV